MTTLPTDAWAGVLGSHPVTSRSPERMTLWSVTAMDGRRYLLKMLGTSPGASLADEYRVALHLQAAGVPVAPPQVTDDGKLYARAGDKTCVLVPELPVDAIDHELEPDAAAICYRIGQVIGQMDNALSTYPWPIQSFEHDLIPQTFGLRYPQLPPDLTTHTVEPLRDRVIGALTGLPMQRIHGDCNPGNVLLHRKTDGIEVSGMIDLDHLPMGQRVYDLGYYLHYRAREIVKNHPGQQRGHGTQYIHLIGRYVAGYHAANPLSGAEIAAIVPTILSAEITSTAWSYLILTNQLTRDKTGQAEAYQAGSRSLAWMCDHFDQLDGAIQASVSA